ncbi:MAG: RICIN domain-containing protein, partial [Bryobacteraceae bacterium]
WKLQPVSGGYYEVVVEHSGKCLDVAGGPTSTADGAHLQQWTCSGGDNQKWQLIPTS